MFESSEFCCRELNISEKFVAICYQRLSHPRTGVTMLRSCGAMVSDLTSGSSSLTGSESSSSESSTEQLKETPTFSTSRASPAAWDSPQCCCHSCIPCLWSEWTRRESQWETSQGCVWRADLGNPGSSLVRSWWVIQLETSRDTWTRWRPTARLSAMSSGRVTCTSGKQLIYCHNPSPSPESKVQV